MRREYRVQSTGYRVQGTECRVQSAGYRTDNEPEGKCLPFVIDAVLGRYDSRPADQQEGLRYSRAVMLYHAERFEDAFGLFEELVAQWPDSLDEIGWLGVTAAAVGYRDSALAMMERVGDLDLPYRRHEKAGNQAAIAAALGDRELAMQYLRQAFARGRAHGLSLHREPYWDSLRDYAPFQELMRPKG
jgi:tetratricopeptide (TPR) repeat protein